MDGFWAELFALPTVIFTGLLSLSILYWLGVVLGALDIDMLDLDGTLDAMEGAVEGAVDGVVEGAVDAAVDGAVDAAVDGAAEGAADAADGGGEHGIAGMLSVLGIRNVPVSFSGSVWFLWSWIASYLFMHNVAPLLGALPHWLVAAAVFGVSLVLGLLATSASVRPFGRVFDTHLGVEKHTLVGKPCTITTQSVDGSYGQAVCEDGGAGVVLQVRYDGNAPPNKGQRALLVDYDDARDVYVIEPLDPELTGDSRVQA
jgi:hypothetical protein